MRIKLLMFILSFLVTTAYAIQYVPTGQVTNKSDVPGPYATEALNYLYRFYIPKGGESNQIWKSFGTTDVYGAKQGTWVYFSDLFNPTGVVRVWDDFNIFTNLLGSEDNIFISDGKTGHWGTISSILPTDVIRNYDDFSKFTNLLGESGQVFISDGKTGHWGTIAIPSNIVFNYNDFTVFTNLDGDPGQVFKSLGDGTGSWQEDLSGNIVVWTGEIDNGNGNGDLNNTNNWDTHKLPTISDIALITNATYSPGQGTLNSYLTIVKDNAQILSTIHIKGDVVFLGTSQNSSHIMGTAKFYSNSLNTIIGEIDGKSIFFDSSKNQGLLSGGAQFLSTSTNAGIVYINAEFGGASVCESIGAASITIDGNAVFTSTSKNYGMISGNAVFNDSSKNYYVINGNATFLGSSINESSGVIYGDSWFTGSSVNNGSAFGAVYNNKIGGLQYENIATGKYSVAMGAGNRSYGDYSYAYGKIAVATNDDSWVWGADPSNLIGEVQNREYKSHGDKTFNINPSNGIYGFFIGETNLHAHVTNIVGDTTRFAIKNGDLTQFTNILGAVSNVFIAESNRTGKWVTADSILDTNMWARRDRDFIQFTNLSASASNVFIYMDNGTGMWVGADSLLDTNMWARRDRDFTQFTNIATTVGQVFKTLGDGTGSWQDDDTYYYPERRLFPGLNPLDVSASIRGSSDTLNSLAGGTFEGSGLIWSTIFQKMIAVDDGGTIAFFNYNGEKDTPIINLINTLNYTGRPVLSDRKYDLEAVTIVDPTDTKYIYIGAERIGAYNLWAPSMIIKYDHTVPTSTDRHTLWDISNIISNSTTDVYGNEQLEGVTWIPAEDIPDWMTELYTCPDGLFLVSSQVDGKFYFINIDVNAAAGGLVVQKVPATDGIYSWYPDLDANHSIHNVSDIHWDREYKVLYILTDDGAVQTLYAYSLEADHVLTEWDIPSTSDEFSSPEGFAIGEDRNTIFIANDGGNDASHDNIYRYDLQVRGENNLRQRNVTMLRDPDVNDNSSLGYGIGSRWDNSKDQRVWVNISTNDGISGSDAMWRMIVSSNIYLTTNGYLQLENATAPANPWRLGVINGDVQFEQKIGGNWTPVSFSLLP